MDIKRSLKIACKAIATVGCYIVLLAVILMLITLLQTPLQSIIAIVGIVMLLAEAYMYFDVTED